MFARKRGVALYLAGGVVRDLLLGLPIRDLDLVVEAEGIEFARDVAAQLAASIKEHGRFGTAALGLPNGEKIDVASTRLETYAYPGALPAIVSGASIEEDLARRDFTVNAMAIELEPRSRHIDPFGGVEDLERGVIRQLHDRCFLDDPTRAFRAVRYANRLGFRIGAATRKNIVVSLRHGALGRMSGDRLRRELRLILEEPERGRAVAKLGALGLSGALDPALARDRRAAARVARAELLSASVEGKLTWLCYLLAWMWQAGEREADADRDHRQGDDGALQGPVGQADDLVRPEDG